MLKEDFDLREAMIAGISSSDGVAALFTSLGYNTGNRVTLTAEALAIPDNMRREVRSIERIAEDGLLQVYLFRLERVNKAVINTLARVFRDRGGEFLLVLTKDFDGLDFVLLERQAAVGGTANPLAALTSGQPTMRTYPLSVERRNPKPIAVRVLRRFSYTEPDEFAQLEKLKAAYDMAYWSEPLFNNRALFSDYFLKERLRSNKGQMGSEFYDEWQTDVKPAFQRLRQLYSAVRQRLAGADEQQTRTALIEPALREALGFILEPGRGEDAPTYNLYAADLMGKPLAVCLAYRWERRLDNAAEDEPAPASANPTARAVKLLEDNQAEWVIVTNGRLWRLYSAQAHSRATNYYEIDLEENLSGPGAEAQASVSYADAVKYWLLFFRAQAFIPRTLPIEGQSRTLSFLAWVMDRSEDYAKKIGDKLKDRIFDDIFPYFAEGFVRNMQAQGKANPSEAELRAVFQGTLTFLYRLLFLLYAESRSLLPLNEVRSYWEISLERLKKEVEDKAGTIEDEVIKRLNATYSPSDTTLYERLMELFHAIDVGDPSRNVPVYNGGLFLSNPPADDASAEAINARFLTTYRVPDRYLALGLDRLARDIDDKTHALAAIDYKSLGVRQLGSIYEGLLEFTVQQASEKMAVVRDKKKKELIVPYAQAVKDGLTIIKQRGVERTYGKGDVYLVNDKRERKVSGSYYTPDYIVEYIVAHTVGPVLDEKLEALRPRLRAAQAALYAERGKAERAGTVNAEAQAYAKHKDMVDALFDMRVLDPAMGSGHFLVEAVDFITDRLLKFLASYPWNPITYALKDSRETILKAMAEQGVSVDPARLTDTNLLKRQVLKRCIYGVDLNPMAVELAKVSLWLDCFTLGAPLSFLDHHMKCGNSLIGAQVEEARKVIEQGQLSMFGHNLFAGAMLATDLMRQVGELPDATAGQVRQSRAEYRQATNQLAPFKRILDVYTSRWFGNTPYKAGKGKAAQIIDPTIYFLRTRENEAWLTDPTAGGAYGKLNLGDRKVADTAVAATAQYRFFHWELEFPEVFFAPRVGTTQVIEPKPNAGFDAVIGNPPYVRQEELTPIKPVLGATYPKAYDSSADLYVYFFAKGLILICNEGRAGFITSNKFMRAGYGKALRNHLSTQSTMEQIIDFGELPVFSDAATFPAIYLYKKQQPRDSHVVVLAAMTKLQSTSIELEKDVEQHQSPQGQTEFAANLEGWVISKRPTANLLRRIETIGTPITKYVNGKIELGIKTGYNKAFIIDEDTKNKLIADDPACSVIIKPHLAGDDVRRYYVDFNNNYLIWTYIGVPIQNFPAIMAYLQQYQQQLESRSDQGDFWWELRPCSYYSDFDNPKIVYPDISMSNRFYLDHEGFYLGNTSYIIPKNDGYLLALLNSHLVWFYLKQTSQVLGDADAGGRLRLFTIYIERIPIFVPNQATPTDEKARLVDQGVGIVASNVQALTWIDARVAASQQDVVAELLAHLADEMLKLNKERQVEVRRFLAYLEGQVGAKVDTLSGKTTIQEYAGDYQKSQSPAAWPELARVLAKNAATRHRIPLVETALAIEYERSLTILAPIIAQLAATDRLIDQIVYKLYGLTEAEIAVVEGRS